MCLLRRSLGRNGCRVKHALLLQGDMLATKVPFEPSIVLGLSVYQCVLKRLFSDERHRATRWRCWLVLRCSILPQAAPFFTSTQMLPIPRATYARRCTCPPWWLPGWTWSARPGLSLGILRCHSTQRQAMPFLCIAPGAHLPPLSSTPLT